MLLVLVCIAALLVPAHHRLEKWITHSLTEKNKKMRLAVAKKLLQDGKGKKQVKYLLAFIVYSLQLGIIAFLYMSYRKQIVGLTLKDFTRR